MKRADFKKYQSVITDIFLIGLWIFFPYLFFLSLTKPLYQDEGIFLAVGRGLSEGKFPYLDFWDHKTPGIYFLWSWLYPVFGTKIIFYKIFVWFVNFLSAIFIFGITEKFKKGFGKFAVVIFLYSIVFFEGNYLIAAPFLAFFLTLGTWLVLARREPWSIFVAGLSIGVAIIFKQNAILSLIPFLVYFIWGREFKKLAYFMVGFILPICGLLIYLGTNNLFTVFYNQAIRASLIDYPHENIFLVLKLWSETFIRVWWLWVGAIISLPMIFQNKQKREYMLIFLLSIVPVVSFFVRHYPHYWLQVLPFLSVLAALGISVIIDTFMAKKWNLLAVIFYIIILLSLFQNLLWFKWVTKNYNHPKEVEQAQAAGFIKKIPDAKILAENRFTGLLFLSGREPLTKYLYLTEVNEPEKAREKTLQALKNETNIIILWPTDQKYVYAKEIGDWVYENTQKVADFPELEMSVYLKN